MRVTLSVNNGQAGAPIPYFHEADGLFHPTDAAGGYWRPNTLGGRFVGGLIGLGLERAYAEPDLVPARLTVDMMKMAPKAPLKVETRVVRRGGRLLLAEAQLLAGDDLIAQASCMFLRASEAPVAPTLNAPAWDAPPPSALKPQADLAHWEIRPVPAGERRRSRPDLVPVATRNPPVLGPLSGFDARQAWVRENRALVGGLPHTPFVRVALAADFASPLAHSSETSIDYVNCDFTVYMHRLPAGEWLGFDMSRHYSAAGVAVGECWLFDEIGPLGTVSTAAIVQRQA